MNPSPVVSKSVGEKQIRILIRILRWEIGYLSKKPVGKRILAEKENAQYVLGDN